MLSFDLAGLPQHFSERLPRRAIAGILFAGGGFLLLAWLGRIVPLSFLSGILLLRRSAWGYLLTPVAVMKFLTMGACVSAMGISMVLAGVDASPVELIVFPSLTLLNVIMAGRLLKNIDVRYKYHQPTSSVLLPLH